MRPMMMSAFAEKFFSHPMIPRALAHTLAVGVLAELGGATWLSTRSGAVRSAPRALDLEALDRLRLGDRALERAGGWRLIDGEIGYDDDSYAVFGPEPAYDYLD